MPLESAQNEYKMIVEYGDKYSEAKFYIDDKRVFGFRFETYDRFGRHSDFAKELMEQVKDVGVDTINYVHLQRAEVHGDIILITTKSFSDFKRLVVAEVLLASLPNNGRILSAFILGARMPQKEVDIWYDFLISAYNSQDRERRINSTAHALRVFYGFSR